MVIFKAILVDIQSLLHAAPDWGILLLAAISGAVWGSFVGALVTRWPRGRSVVSGRSDCDHCGCRLHWFEMFPILSFLLAGGRCRNCEGRIDPVHLIAEILAALTGFMACYLLPPDQAISTMIFGWLLLPLALLDARHFWLPDRLIFLLGAVGIFRLLLIGDSLLIFTVAFSGFLLLQFLRQAFFKVHGHHGMGAGDPKLLAAILLWLPVGSIPHFILMASSMGIIWVLMQREGAIRERQIPFGTCLAISALFFSFLN